MTNDRLSRAYLEKAGIRLQALKFMHDKKGYSDVVGEAEECVEPLLKAVLMILGLEVPKTHDVSRAFHENRQLLPEIIQENLEEITVISRSLRKDRELAFYGSEDWIPTEEYQEGDSLEAIKKAEKIFSWVTQAFEKK